jgi:tRNA dimethylallyltransferase
MLDLWSATMQAGAGRTSLKEDDLSTLVVVLGPTGSGKSELGIRLAEQLSGEIVNYDSVQIYQRFNVGTAKVPESERRGIPHHLIDLVEPSELFTAGDYAAAAEKVLLEISGRGKTPILVGGSGFYLRALLDGLSPGPKRNEALRENLLRREHRRPGALHRILRRLDASSAARIHANDRNKTLRALEVRLIEGRPMAEMFAKPRAPLSDFQPVKLGLTPDRDLLYRKLDSRTTTMFERGLVDEVRNLLASGIASKVKPFESLGYAQALRVVEGRITLDEAIDSTKQQTRRYAKRQLTWFRKEPNVHWLEGFGNDPATEQQALALLRGLT